MRKLLFLAVCFFATSHLFGQSLKITHLSGDFYIYTTYSTYEGSRIPANGMYLLTPEGAVLFDTPWDTTQFQPLLDSIQMKHGQAVTMCLATHWHSDRTEGLAYYKQLGIRTYTTTLTDEWSRKNNKKRAEYLMTGDTVFQVGKYAFEVYYPGEGHTADNIIVWFGKERILYGGCLIKGVDAKNLGFLGDANVTAYETTLRNVQQKCPDPNFIIISHSNWDNNKSLKHSIKLAKRLKKKST